jgi:hypothetical protein
MQLTASLVSLDVPSRSEIRRPRIVPHEHFCPWICILQALHTKYLVHWCDLSEESKRIPVWNDLNHSLDMLFHVYLLSENLDWLINQIISNMPPQAWPMSLFDIFGSIRYSYRHILPILTNKVNMSTYFGNCLLSSINLGYFYILN